MPVVATWNVNSIKARLPQVLDWLGGVRPDVLLLQEIKCEAHAFPALEFEALGYRVAALGQRTYNGVAIVSREPMRDLFEGLPGDPADDHARYLEATVGDLRVASLYLPNGNPPESDKYPYKLSWMDRLRERAAALLESEQAVVLGGDYNVIPADEDCYDPAAWTGDALFLPETRRRYRALLNLGLTDAFRAVHPDERAYTFWDYQAGRWHHNEGVRIDHFLLSPQAADRLRDCTIDRRPRGRPKASDHTPVLVTLD